MKFIIKIEDLNVSFNTDDYLLTAIDNLYLTVRKGETLAIIGESGSGKSVLGLAILGILPDNAEVSGKILFKGKDLLKASYSEYEAIRGKMISWVPQNPKLCANPSMKIWKQIAEPQVVHNKCTWQIAKKHAIDMLEKFHIRPAEQWANEYPVSYSGGMLQRAMVAMGTSADPEVVIADEPTKGIDPINKADVTEMFSDLKHKGITQILITHDLDFAAEIADRIVVIYCGQIIEITDAYEFFKKPRHPYSYALLRSLPQNGLNPIRGSALPLHIRSSGCKFRDRCPDSDEQCKTNFNFPTPITENYVRCTHTNFRNRT